MRTLYHTWLCPFSRKIRIQLAEKHLDFNLKFVRIWEKPIDFIQMNPNGQTPVLIDLNGSMAVESAAIGEYLEEVYPEIPLLPKNPSDRAEARRLASWFEMKFYDEVTVNLVFQKTLKHYFGLGGPDSARIREGQARLIDHLDYIGWLIDRRRWLAGDQMTLADLSAAAQLSCIDYLGDVPWEKNTNAKDWYARIKSRPSFRSILQDKFPPLPPSKHYENLDF
jgi:glutathione S-transferase